MALLITVAAAIMGGLLLEIIRVPAGALIGAAIGVGLVNIFGFPAPDLPNEARFLGFVAIGWLVGADVDRQVLSEMSSNLPAIFLTVAGLVIFGGILAVLLVRFGGLDPITSFLGASPGGLSQMAALSSSVGGNAAIVATLHTLRVVVVIALAPLVVRWIGASQ